MSSKHTNQPIYHDGGCYEGVIKGHFWVERDGEIIDYDFPENENCKLANMCYGEKQYRRATKARRSAIKRKFINAKFQELKAMKESTHRHDRMLYKDYVRACPMNDRCATNVCIEKLERGGTIIYGDMGWKTKLEESDIYWEYEDKRTPESVRANLAKMTHEEKMNYAKYVSPDLASSLQTPDQEEEKTIKHITRVVEKLGGRMLMEGNNAYISTPDEVDEEEFKKALAKELNKLGWDMD